jgi:hypothetical protein
MPGSPISGCHRQGAVLGNVLNLNIFPVALQVFGNQAAVAMNGLLFATQETPAVQHLPGRGFFDVPRLHQIEKLPLI